MILHVAGQVDLVTAPTLKEHLRAAVERLPGGLLVLDLRGVDFLSSVGLSLLVETHLDTQRANSCWDVRVVAEQPVIRPITTTGLRQLLAPYSTLDEALASASRHG